MKKKEQTKEKGTWGGWRGGVKPTLPPEIRRVGKMYSLDPKTVAAVKQVSIAAELSESRWVEKALLEAIAHAQKSSQK